MIPLPVEIIEKKVKNNIATIQSTWYIVIVVGEITNNNQQQKGRCKMTCREIKQSLDNPATSYWLKKAINEIDKRDVLDATIDVDILLCYCKSKLQEMNVPYMEHCMSESVPMPKF